MIQILQRFAYRKLIIHSVSIPTNKAESAGAMLYCISMNLGMKNPKQADTASSEHVASVIIAHTKLVKMRLAEEMKSAVEKERSE